VTLDILSKSIESSSFGVRAIKLTYRNIKKICSVLDTAADYLLGSSDDPPFKMGGFDRGAGGKRVTICICD
jgi:hypothetical protein